MDRSGLWLIGTGLVVIVFLDLLFVELRRVLREAKRIVTRLEGYSELPVFALLANSDRDIARIVNAIDAVPPLIERGQRALGVVRSGYKPKGSSPG